MGGRVVLLYAALGEGFACDPSELEILSQSKMILWHCFVVFNMRIRILNRASEVQTCRDDTANLVTNLACDKGFSQVVPLRRVVLDARCSVTMLCFERVLSLLFRKDMASRR